MPQSSIQPKPSMWVLYFAIISMGMGQTLVFAVIPFLGRELGLDQIIISLPWLGIEYAPKELAITSLASMSALIFFLAAPYWGRKSELLGRKRVIIIGLLGYTVGTLIFNGVAYAGLVSAVSGVVLYFLLMVSRAALVVVMAATMPASSAYGNFSISRGNIN